MTWQQFYPTTKLRNRSCSTQISQKDNFRSMIFFEFPKWSFRNFFQDIIISLFDVPEKALPILIRVVIVPATNPVNPNIIIKIFFAIFHLNLPRPSGHCTSISSMGGNMRAIALLDKAPMSDIIKSKCGTLAAIPTEKQW